MTEKEKQACESRALHIIQTSLDRIARTVAQQTVSELKRAGLIKCGHMGSFKKTEQVLYHYSEWIKDDNASEQTKKFCELVSASLDKLKDDPYYEIIELKYFEGQTHEKIAEYFDVDVSLISKRRTKLVNRLRPILFSDDFIRELFEL